ncbi:PAB-dependent poly(A)-specific ribonuclease subunit PAN2 [Neonectria ditissima]|uniref:PAN2-PAN3 deadenylation complex catalytic subunit PAN2 n=1 Tax=Neonectria ditissima TaxID=78410 RepID=A0A0P7BPV9_9HYPO|nr:PAB-dependent poly(A)-specific ribonuclease subunit PAN2 [Neonectria ditissima]
MTFDTSQELLWTGNEYGRVTSFYGTELQRYTSLKAHLSSDGPVRQILINEKGIVALGSKDVHMSLRRGPPIWHIRHDDMKDLRCMSFTSKGTAEILAAGLQDTMLVIDLIKGDVVKRVPTEHQYTIMKRGRYICAATKGGSVNLLDPVTFAVVKTWNAHSALINDMDAQHDFIVTCGYSLRQGQNYMLDPFLNVFDIKKMSSMPPIPFPAGAAFVRMHPRMLTTSIVVSQSGQIHVVDLMNPNTSNVRQANVLTYLIMFEIAPSGEAMALTDAEHLIHLWGSPTKLHFVDLPTPIEFATPEEPLPSIDWTPETPLNSIGLPYYRDVLASAWPDLPCDVGAPPVKYDAQFLSGMKATEFGLYGRNTRGLRRNQIEDTRNVNKFVNSGLKAPKFLSEKARELATSVPRAFDDKVNELAGPLGEMEIESKKSEVPVMYRNVEIKYSKFGVDDFDFGFYNMTRYSGLETHISNSYANSLLQIMHFTPVIRNLALQHAASACVGELCLLCELGFLFDMLEKADGSICQATNMLKTLSHHPAAGSLGLLEEETHGSPLNVMLQGLTRFFCDGAVLLLNTAITSEDHRALWSTPGWLPEEIGIIVEQGQFFCYEGEDLKLHLQRGMHNITVYSLIGMAINIESGQTQKSHLVSIVNVGHAALETPSESQWHLFNDFLVRSVSTEEALTFNTSWKVPSVVAYQAKEANNKLDTDWRQNLDTSILYHDVVANPNTDTESKTYQLLKPEIEAPGPETIIALDTEFVAVRQPEIEMNSDGERETIRPIVYALARASVVRGQGEDEGTPFIDDYIAIREPIVDYLTSYSGITEQDLDPRVSKHSLLPLKMAYKKIWILLNLGCKFLGHGLKQDFRVMNIHVPKSQVIDTIDLFFLKSRLRKLSLAFLAWYLLKEDIQMETHDSIEDSRTALKLYRKFLEFQDAGILETMLQDIYRAGREVNFKPPRKDDGQIPRSETPPPLPVDGAAPPSTPCDGGRPSCQRCLTRNELCVGYRDEADLVFQHETDKVVLKSQTESVSSSTSTSRSGRRTRSRSLERPPTAQLLDASHLQLPSNLPWLKTPPSEKTLPSVEDRAVSIFMDKYVIYPCHESSSPGFLEHLPCLFKEVNVNGRHALRWAVQAAAVADLSRDQSPEILAPRALEYYGRALSALGNSLAEKGKIPDDYDLMTVVILDLFETLFIPETASSGSHAQGMAHILRLRGHEQFHDARGWSLFRLAHHRLQKQQLAKKMDPLPESKVWLDTLNEEMSTVRLEKDALEVSTMCQRANEILESLGADTIDFQQIIELIPEITHLDQQAVMRRSRPEWWFKTLQKSEVSGDQGIISRFPDKIEIHRDVWNAYEWCYHRSARIILHQKLLACLDKAKSISPPQWYPNFEAVIRDQEQESLRTIETLSDEILATVPQSFGDVDHLGRCLPDPSKPPRCQAIGAYLLLWPMRILKDAKGMSTPSQQAAAQIVFERIRECTGMKSNLGALSMI